jgi:hypothetical protein
VGVMMGNALLLGGARKEQDRARGAIQVQEREKSREERPPRLV